MTASIESFVAVIKRSGLVDGTVLGETLESFATTHNADKTSLNAANFAQYLVDKNVITLWQADKLLKGKHKGFFLGKYRLLRILGKGGMSSVYLAEHVLMRRRCAIKVLPHKRVADTSYLDRFHKEAQAVAALDHPNIVRAYDVDHEVDGNIEINFLVMEYVEGQNLYELVQREGVLSPVKTADLIRQGALGLEHAHSAGLVHRDIKPGNFLIDTNGIVKLMDLGLARMFDESDEHSLTIEHDEKVLGTADYLAPEQAVDSHNVDTRADIYGLGCTMYYLLTGHPPFNEGTLTQRLLAHQNKQPPPVQNERDDVPESLIEILLGMMQKKKEDRTQSAGEVVTLLTDWLHDHGGNEWTPPIDRSKRSKDSEANRQSREDRKHNEPTTPKVGVELGTFLTTLNESDIVNKTGSSITNKSNPEFKLGKSKTKSDPLLKTEQLTILESLTVPTPARNKPNSITVQNSESETSRIPSDNTPQTRTSRFQFNLRDSRTVISLVVALLAIIGILAVAPLFMADSDTPQVTKNGSLPTVTPSDEPVPPTRPTVQGDFITVGPVGNFATLQAAIDHISDQALSGGTSSLINEIRVAPGTTLTENIKIDNKDLGVFPADVKIIGVGPQIPTLKPATNDAPIITLNGIEKLRLENFVIDANSQAQACELSGYLVGTRLVNLKFINVSNTAIRATNVAGLGGDKLFIENCTFEGNSTSATLIELEEDSRKVLIQNCQFIGPAMSSISISGTAWDIEVQRNIFTTCEQGLVLKGSDQDISSLTISNNTFHNLNRGVVFEAGPNLITKKLSLFQNLFASIKDREVWAYRPEIDQAQLKKEAPPWRNNWTDRNAEQTEANSIYIFTDDGHVGKPIGFQSTKHKQDNFFKPNNGEVREVVKNKVGSHNFIGAIEP